MIHKIEYVLWKDSVSLGGWQNEADMKNWECALISTTGVLVEETEDALVLAMSSGKLAENRIFCNWLNIPKVCIVARKTCVLRIKQK